MRSLPREMWRNRQKIRSPHTSAQRPRSLDFFSSTPIAAPLDGVPAWPWLPKPTSLAETLAEERRYYALLFSHEFASSFWKPGEVMTFQVPTQTFTRRMKDGTIGTVKRKGYTRRSAREDAWLYHLKELAAAEEPLRYMRRYLRVEDELVEDELVGNGLEEQG